MPTIVGRNVKIEVALTFSAAQNPTAVTKASPGAVTLTSHGLSDGAVGYWSSVTAGMVQLQDQAFMVTGSTTNAFNLAGLDTTDYDTYTAGSITMAATWGTLSESAGYSIGGGAIDQLEDTRLHEAKRSNIAGLLPAEDLTINIRNQETDGTAMSFVRGKAVRGLNVLVKITKGSTVLRVAYGTPGLPSEDTQSGAGANGSFNIIVPKWITKPNV